MSPKNFSNQSNVRLGYNLGLLGFDYFRIRLIRNLLMNRLQWWLSGRVFDSLSDFCFGHGFESHPHHKILLWYVKKGGYTSQTFLVCLPLNVKISGFKKNWLLSWSEISWFLRKIKNSYRGKNFMPLRRWLFFGCLLVKNGPRRAMNPIIWSWGTLYLCPKLS